MKTDILILLVFCSCKTSKPRCSSTHEALPRQSLSPSAIYKARRSFQSPDRANRIFGAQSSFFLYSPASRILETCRACSRPTVVHRMKCRRRYIRRKMHSRLCIYTIYRPASLMRARARILRSKVQRLLYFELSISYDYYFLYLLLAFVYRETLFRLYLGMSDTYTTVTTYTLYIDPEARQRLPKAISFICLRSVKGVYINITPPLLFSEV